MIRILVVDDQPLVRAGIRAVLSAATPDRRWRGRGGRSALQQLRRHPADVVLMELRMPVMDGLEATRRIVADPELAAVEVVSLTTFNTDELVFAALRAGVSGFLLKDTDPDELRCAVRVTAAGAALLSPAVTRHAMHAAAGTPTDPPPLRHLTDREQEVLATVGQGLSNDEIVQLLHMSPRHRAPTSAACCQARRP